MTPERLRWCLDAIGWSNRRFGKMVERDEATVRFWLNGTHPVPFAVGKWIEGIAEHVAAHPPPWLKKTH